jgi:hypothetical protein
MGVEEFQHFVDTWEERSGVCRVPKIEVVIADLENPEKGEPSDELRDMTWETGLREAFEGDGGREVGDCLADKSVVPREEVVE